MAFMQKQITAKQLWIEVDGNQGTDFIPADLVGGHLAPAGTVYTDEVTGFVALAARIGDYTHSTVFWSLTVVEGYGARLSALGFMDCTDWTVHATEVEAAEYLEETYPDDESDDDDTDAARGETGTQFGHA